MVVYDKFSMRDFERVLRACIVISFRYNIILGRNPNVQEEVYNRVALQVYNNQITNVSSIIEELKEIYPSDEDFENNFATKSINTKRNKRLVRYILFALENQLASTDRDFDDESGTIEHILPENPSSEWAAIFDVERQIELIYRLGNLTLLESKLNKECQNATYAVKLPIYKTSQYRLTNSIDFPEWTESQLRSRQRKLAKIATSVWRL